MFESANLSRDNLSREIGRTGDTSAVPDTGHARRGGAGGEQMYPLLVGVFGLGALGCSGFRVLGFDQMVKDPRLTRLSITIKTIKLPNGTVSTSSRGEGRVAPREAWRETASRLVPASAASSYMRMICMLLMSLFNGNIRCI